MRYLLDTCTFLWLSIDSKRLSATARDIIADTDQDTFVSPISSAEIATKCSLGKLDLPTPIERFVAELRETYLLESLPFDEEAALHMARLPWLHRDPFDRMLVSQAIVHGLVLLTPDKAITQYPARTMW